MQSWRMRIMAVVGAITVLAAGAFLFIATPPYAAAQPSPPKEKRHHGGEEQRQAMQERREAMLARVAANLGVSPGQLQQAFKQAQKDMVAQALLEGKITQEVADRINTRIDQGAGPLNPQAGRLGPQGRPGVGPLRGVGPQQRALGGFVAQTLGMTPEELRTEVRNGKSLAQIGQEHGVSREQLRSTLLGSLQSRLDQTQQSGNLSADRAAQMLQRLERQVDQMLDAGLGNANRSRPART